MPQASTPWKDTPRRWITKSEDLACARCWLSRHTRRTKLSGNTKSAKISLDVYADERKRVTEMAQQEIEHGDDPRIVADAAWNALTAKSPRLRYPVGKGVALSRLRRFVPAGMFDKSLRKQFQLD